MPTDVVEEPAWLPRLRRALHRSRTAGARQVTVEADDLEAVIGAVQEGPGGAILVAGWPQGHVTVDFQKLIKAAYFTPDEARQFADTLKRQADVAEGTHLIICGTPDAES